MKNRLFTLLLLSGALTWTTGCSDDTEVEVEGGGTTMEDGAMDDGAMGDDVMADDMMADSATGGGMMTDSAATGTPAPAAPVAGSPDAGQTAGLLEGGLTSIAVPAAVGNIDGWLTRLEGAQFAGAADVRTDLQALRTALQATPLNGAEVARLLGELGTATTAAAGGATGADATGLRRLGAALTAGAGQLGGAQ